MINCFTPKSNISNSEKSSEPTSNTSVPKMVLSTSVMPSLSAISLSNNSVYSSNKKTPKPSNIKKSYVQVLKANISPNVEEVF